ncbi:MAG TPA: hypothetical protein VID50_05750 [Candidatus Eisenbacteria bacterium]|jgi:hypothetical protein
MVTRDDSELSLPDLRFVPVASLLPHEMEDVRRARALARRLREEGEMKNPPVVAPVASPAAGDRYVLLDGANRYSAVRASRFPDILVQRVRYEDPRIVLSTWHHALEEEPAGDLARELGRINGLTLETRPIEEARAALAAREALAYVAGSQAEAVALRGGGDLAGRMALLSAVVEIYRGRFPIHRVTTESLSAARARLPRTSVMVVFPTFEKREILDAACEGALLPAGITRHLIPGRALRVHMPLDRLADAVESVEEKNRWLHDWIARRVATHRVRFYEESTILFDE